MPASLVANERVVDKLYILPARARLGAVSHNTLGTMSKFVVLLSSVRRVHYHINSAEMALETSLGLTRPFEARAWHTPRGWCKNIPRKLKIYSAIAECHQVPCFTCCKRTSRGQNLHINRLGLLIGGVSRRKPGAVKQVRRLAEVVRLCTSNAAEMTLETSLLDVSRSVPTPFCSRGEMILETSLDLGCITIYPHALLYFIVTFSTRVDCH